MSFQDWNLFSKLIVCFWAGVGVCVWNRRLFSKTGQEFVWVENWNLFLALARGSAAGFFCHFLRCFDLTTRRYSKEGAKLTFSNASEVWIGVALICTRETLKDSGPDSKMSSWCKWPFSSLIFIHNKQQQFVNPLATQHSFQLSLRVTSPRKNWFFVKNQGILSRAYHFTRLHRRLHVNREFQ